MSWSPAPSHFGTPNARDQEASLRHQLATQAEDLHGFQRQVSWLLRENCALQSLCFRMIPGKYGSIRNMLLGRELAEMIKINRPLETTDGTPLILSYAGRTGPYKRLLFDECSPDALPPGLRPFHREVFSDTISLEGCLCARYGPPVTAILDGLRTLADPNEDTRVRPPISPTPMANPPPTAPRPPVAHVRVVTGLARRPLPSRGSSVPKSGKRQRSRSSTKKKKDLVVKVATSGTPATSVYAPTTDLLPDFHDESQTLCHSFKSHKGCADRPNCPYHHYRKRPCVHGAACQYHAGNRGAKGCTFDHIDHLGRPLFALEPSDQEQENPTRTKVYWIRNGNPQIGNPALDDSADGDQWQVLLDQNKI
jgi:hypothetical protein